MVHPASINGTGESKIIEHVSEKIETEYDSKKDSLCLPDGLSSRDKLWTLFLRVHRQTEEMKALEKTLRKNKTVTNAVIGALRSAYFSFFNKRITSDSNEAVAAMIAIAEAALQGTSSKNGNGKAQPLPRERTTERCTSTLANTKDSVMSPLEMYLYAIDGSPLLSAQEEKDLAYRIAEGDMEARNKMVRANLRLVVNIARDYTGRGLSLQDLIEEGNLGLIRATHGFDPTMNTRFSTYATYWVKQSIKRALVNTTKTIRVPAYMVELLTQWKRASAQLLLDVGRSPTHEEITKKLDIGKKKLTIIKRALPIFDAGVLPQNEDGEGMSLDELIADNRTQDSYAIMQDKERRASVSRLMNTLTKRERKVLRMRFGLDNEQVLTLKEIGHKLNITRERVRQIQNKALAKLQIRAVALDRGESLQQGPSSEEGAPPASQGGKTVSEETHGLPLQNMMNYFSAMDALSETFPLCKVNAWKEKLKIIIEEYPRLPERFYQLRDEIQEAKNM